jgi:hypothetical protein
MPGRSGVTAPIKPDNRTTGTTADPRRRRAGIHSISLSTRSGNLPRLSVISVMPLPRKLTVFYHAAVIESNGTPFALQSLSGCNGAAEKYMKIYLLILLIGALLTAIHFTSAPERSETLPQ